MCSPFATYAANLDTSKGGKMNFLKVHKEIRLTLRASKADLLTVPRRLL